MKVAQHHKNTLFFLIYRTDLTNAAKLSTNLFAQAFLTATKNNTSKLQNDITNKKMKMFCLPNTTHEIHEEHTYKKVTIEM